MAICEQAPKWMLDNPIRVKISGPLNFAIAKSIADQKARENAVEPRVVAWFDKKSREIVPDQICGDCNKPRWLAYVETRGPSIAVDINDEEYVFVYRDMDCDRLTQ